MRNILFLTVLCLISALILETDASPKRPPNKPTSPNSTSQQKNSNITAETAGTSSPGNAQPVIETSLDTSPKLRVLIITHRSQISESHYMLHRKLAELLAADTENVENVLLLVFTNNDCANESNEMPPEFDGRLLVWTRLDLEMFGGCNWTVWDDITKWFLPNGNITESIQLDFLTKNPALIQQLQEFKFNVGVMETFSYDHSLSLFRSFPTIKKYIGSQSTSPTIAQWKYFGYDKFVGAMPGRDLARIGDHKFATENAIKENPNYFREINDFFIDSVESSTKLLKLKYFEAIDKGILSKQNFADLFLHENIAEWDMKHRMDLYFTNTQPFLDLLLSFGSAVEMDDSDERAVSVKNIVVDVFKQYPQMNLIIKWGKRPPTGTVEQYNKLSENVYAKSWLEQAAILGGGLKLFITHGGQNSINEAVKFGVPIILLPFFGDQYNNAEALAAREVAKVLDIRSKTLNKDLTEALHEMFNKYSEYKAGMDELSKKMNSVEPAKEFVEKFRQLRKSYCIGPKEGRVADIIRAFQPTVLSSEVKVLVIIAGRDSLMGGETAEAILEQFQVLVEICKRFGHVKVLWSCPPYVHAKKPEFESLVKGMQGMINDQPAIFPYLHHGDRALGLRNFRFGDGFNQHLVKEDGEMKNAGGKGFKGVDYNSNL
uniref:glucuronosyltransferase n=1 Tax=Globodera pallida TaxID=36090 RepID=A0A183C0I4_GLOPA